MISINLPIQTSANYRKYFIEFPPDNNYELSVIAKKNSGLVNVKISKPTSFGTEEQNRTLHALLQAFFVTGLHSAPDPFSKSLANFKVWIKIQYGPCFCLDMDGKQIKIPKSWTDYTKLERTALIEGLLSEIYASMAYAESDKIKEILAGMETEK